MLESSRRDGNAARRPQSGTAAPGNAIDARLNNGNSTDVSVPDCLEANRQGDVMAYIGCVPSKAEGGSRDVGGRSSADCLAVLQVAVRPVLERGHIQRHGLRDAVDREVPGDGRWARPGSRCHGWPVKFQMSGAALNAIGKINARHRKTKITVQATASR